MLKSPFLPDIPPIHTTVWFSIITGSCLFELITSWHRLIYSLQTYLTEWKQQLTFFFGQPNALNPPLTHGVKHYVSLDPPKNLWLSHTRINNKGNTKCQSERVSQGISGGKECDWPFSSHWFDISKTFLSFEIFVFVGSRTSSCLSLGCNRPNDTFNQEVKNIWIVVFQTETVT